MGVCTNVFHVSSVIKIILLASLNLTTAHACTSHDDCGWCGFCVRDSATKPPSRVCYYPFPDVQRKNDKCVEIPLCSKGYCENGGTCTEGRGFAVARCYCDISKYYGARCEHKIEKGSESNFASGIAIFHTVLLGKEKRDTPYTIIVYATVIHSGKDLHFSVETSEGYFVWFNELKGKCNQFSNIPIYTYKKYCSTKEQCVQTLPDCSSVYTGKVMFPYKMGSEPGVLSFVNGNAGYFANFTIVARNLQTEVFSYNYKRMINYEDFGIKNVNVIPGVKLKNCPKYIGRRLIYYRKSNIIFEAKVSDFSGSPTFQQLTTSWSLFYIGHFSEALNDPNIYKWEKAYHWYIQPFLVPIGMFKVQFFVYLVLPTGKISNYDECYFEIAAQPLVAHIEGGAERTVLKGNGLLLTGASSQDPNENHSNQNHLQFSWSCQPNCNGIVRTGQKMFFIKSDQLEEAKKYNFTLKVSVPGLKPEQTHQVVSVDSIGFSIDCIMNCFNKVVPTDPLVLGVRTDLTDEEDFEFIWTYTLEDEKVESVKSIEHSNYPSNLLCIKPNTLEEGKKYYFQASLSESDLTAGIYVHVNQRPSTGNCTVVPEKGVAAKTLFIINCTGFIDEDKTLIYEYFDRDKSDVEKEYSGKMIASNSNGLLQNVKLTRGVVTVNVYDTLGLPAVLKVEVELTPYEASAEDVEKIFTSIEHQNDFGKTETVLKKAAELPDLMSKSMNKSHIAKKLIDSMLKVSFETAGEMKTGLSVMNNTISALTKDEAFIFKPDVLKDFTTLIVSLTKRFEYSTLSTTVVPLITERMLEELTVNFLDVFDSIFGKRNENVSPITEDDMRPSDLKDTQDASVHLENAINYMAYALSYRHKRGFQKHTISSSQTLSSTSTLADTPKNLHAKLKGDAMYSTEISSELVNEFRNLDEVIIESMTVKYNPFWSDRKDISTDITSLNMYKRKSSSDRIVPIHEIKNPVDVFLNINQNNTGSILLISKQVDPTLDKDLLDNKVTVVKIYLTERSRLFVKFSFNSSAEEIRVLITKDFRPDFDSMVKFSKNITSSNPVYDIPYQIKGSDAFIYIGILPGANVLSGHLVTFTLNFYYNLCLTLIRHYWVSEYCSIGDKTNATIIHCRCTHLSIMSAIFAVPPNDIDPFNDISLFLTVKDNALVVTVVLIIILVFFLLLIWAWVKDRKEMVKRKVIDLEDNFPDDPNVYIVAVFTGCRLCAGTSANVGIQLEGDNAIGRTHILKSSSRRLFSCNSDNWFLLRSAKALGVIEKIHLWHDNSGPSPDWFCEKIVVFDTSTQTAYTFFVDQWLALDLDEYSEAIVCAATIDDFNSRRRIFFDNLMYGFRNGHVCGSILAKHPRHVMARIDQVVILMTLIMVSMLISIAFYSVINEEGFDESDYSIGTAELIISVQTFVLSLFILFIVILLFNKSYKGKLEASERPSYIYARTQQEGAVLAKKSSSYFKLHEDTKRQPKLSFYKNFVSTLRKSFKPLPLLPITLSDSPSKVARNKKWYILAWSVSLLLVATSSYLVMLYGLKLGYQESKMWMTAVALALFDQLLVVSPLRIVFLALLLASSFESLARATNYNLELKGSYQTKYLVEKSRYSQWAKRRSHLMYRPLTLKEIDVWKLKRQNRELCMSLAELAMVAVFAVILCFANSNHFGHYPIQENLHVGSMVLHGNTPLSVDFDNIFNRTQFQDYLKDSLIQYLFRLKWYNLASLSVQEMQRGTKFWTSDFTMKLMGPPILRQLRVYQSLCFLNKMFRNTSMKCIPKWSTKVEDTDQYEFGWRVAFWSNRKYITNAWLYTEPSKSFFPSLTGKTGIRYHGGGYIAKLSPLRDKTRLDLQILTESHWIDQCTSVVFVTFTLYSVNYNLFTQVILTAEHLPSGQYLTRVVMESVQLRVDISPWKICYLIFLVCFIGRTTLLINRKGFKKHFSGFTNNYKLLLIALGVLCIVFFVMHILKSSVYMKEYFDEGINEFFPFDDIIYYGKLAENTMILLFCGLALYFLTAWHSSRRSFIFYYMVTMSYKHLFWVVILLALFILVVSRTISFLSNILIPISICIWRWFRNFPCGSNNVVIFGLTFVLKIYSIMTFVLFVYLCKLAKLKRQPVRTALVGSLLESRSKESRP